MRSRTIRFREAGKGQKTVDLNVFCSVLLRERNKPKFDRKKYFYFVFYPFDSEGPTQTFFEKWVTRPLDFRELETRKFANFDWFSVFCSCPSTRLEVAEKLDSIWLDWVLWIALSLLPAFWGPFTLEINLRFNANPFSFSTTLEFKTVGGAGVDLGVVKTSRVSLTAPLLFWIH